MKITPAKLILWCACVIAAASLLFVAFQYDQKNARDKTGPKEPAALEKQKVQQEQDAPFFPENRLGQQDQHEEEREAPRETPDGGIVTTEPFPSQPADMKAQADAFRREIEAKKAASRRAFKEVCPLEFTPDMLLMVINAEANMFSTVSIAGQDKETGAYAVTVEPGPDVILVLKADEPTIWKIAGDVQRIKRLVMPENNGAVGLERSRIFFSTGCADALYTRRPIGANVPRRNNVFVGPEKVRIEKDVSPSPSPAKGFDPIGWENVVRFRDKGVLTIDPASVVSLHPAENYLVMPNVAGFSQLLHEGVLELVGDREMVFPNVTRNGERDTKRVHFYDGFKIVRPMKRLPAGMSGSRSAEFTLKIGVPIPPGEPVHSCVREEGTRKPLAGHCR